MQLACRHVGGMVSMVDHSVIIWCNWVLLGSSGWVLCARTPFALVNPNRERT